MSRFVSSHKGVSGRSRRGMLRQEQASAWGGFGLHDCLCSRLRLILGVDKLSFSMPANSCLRISGCVSNRVRPEPWGCGGLRYIARPPLAPTKHGGSDCLRSCGFAKTADCYASGFAARGRTFASICGRLYATGRSQRRVKIAKPIFGPPLGDASARRVAGAIRCCLACKPPCVPSGKTLRYKRNDDSSYLPCPT